MPRTSYGNEKRDQAWRLVEALLNVRGTSPTERVLIDGAEITYSNWIDKANSNKQPSLAVKSSLTSLSQLSNNTLSTEQIRESINEHLGERFLGILDDYRTRKAGRGAETWKFGIRLWSTDIESNRKNFAIFWEEKKNDFSQLASDRQDEVKSFPPSKKTGDGESREVVTENLVNFLQPYEKLVTHIIDHLKIDLGGFPTKNLSNNEIRESILDIILKVSHSDSIFIFEKKSKDKWKSILFVSSVDSKEHLDALHSSVLPVLSERQISLKDSHGRIARHDGSLYIIVPLRSSRSKPSFVCICNPRENDLITGEPFGEILSTVLSIDFRRLPDSQMLEAIILDGLKRSFNFVSPHFYKKRFEIFKTRLNKMTVNFQPIVKLNPLVIEAWEALARDPHSIVGTDPSTMTAPVDLFEAAELWGVEFTTELDLYFLQVSTSKYRELRDSVKLQRFHEILPLSVNVYPSSLLRTVYLEAVKKITSDSTIPAGKLILEISEKSSLPEVPYWSDELMTWKSFKGRLKTFVRESPGIRFAIDDFGVGHASVSRLVGLNLEYVKIDREVLDYPEDVRNKVITFVLEALIEAGNYSPHIVIEGVDKDYPISLSTLLKIGAQSIQGYIVDKPSNKIYERLTDEKFRILQKQLS